ncbi:MAG: hypothetical protein Q8L21_01355 [Candidatus Komeilibacteria bacterium]|nr:hypothetical protein [Candidatus Komeilibacteria bacterium]
MNNDLAKKIITKIREGKLNMRPRWYFILQTAAVLVISVLAFVLAVFLISWLYFILHASGAWLLPAFGSHGWMHFLRSFPWLPASIGLILIMILAFILEKFRWAYRQPALYVGLGIVVLTVLFSLTIARTPVHDIFYQQAFKKGGGPAGSLYRGYGQMPRSSAYTGTVMDVATGTFSITTAEGEVISVATDGRTRFPFGYQLEPNDMVMIMGERTDNILRAFGVREIKDNDGFYPDPRNFGRFPFPRPR